MVRRTARADVYMISIVPAAAHIRATRHSGAIEKVRELARGLESMAGSRAIIRTMRASRASANGNGHARRLI